MKRLYDDVLSTGVHDLSWDGRDEDGRDVAPGVYLSRVSTREGTRTGRVVILKDRP